MAFDREIVIRALEIVQKCNGAEYLEKIIQAPFELPMANSEDICKVFFSKLEDIIADVSEDKWDKNYWSDLFYYGIKHYLDTIRAAIRFTNTFSLKYSTMKDEINVIDLIGLTCLQVFEPDIYSKLPIYSDVLCGTRYGSLDEIGRKELESAWNNIILNVPEDKLEPAENILLRLFPKLSHASKHRDMFYNYSKNDSYQDMMIANSISHKSSFNRYFSLILENEAIPTSYLEWLISIADENEFMEAISKLNSDKKTTTLLDYIEAVFTSRKYISFSEERTNMIFTCLCKIWHTLLDDNESSFLAIPLSWRFSWCISLFLQKLDIDKRYITLHTLFGDINIALSTLSMLLCNLEKAHNRFTDEKRDSDDPQLLTLDLLLQLEKLFVERVTNEIREGGLINDFGLIVSLFENIESEKAKIEIEKMICTDYGLANLVSSAIGEIIGTTRFYTITKESIEKYIDIGIAYERIKAFMDKVEFADLDIESKRELIAFLLFVEKDSNGEIESRGISGGRGDISLNEVTNRLEVIENT